MVAEFGIDPVALTQDLIRIPSHKAELPLVEHIEDLVHDKLPHNFRSHRVETDDPNRPTLLVANSDLPDVVIISHPDTVAPWPHDPTNPIGEGHHDPFGGVIEDGKLYGRGASDAKSGVATALSAVAAFRGHEDDLPKTMLIFPSDEEGSLKGMKAVAAHFEKLIAENPTYRPAFVLSLNGSDNEVGIGCRGVFELELLLRGRTGHAALRKAGQPPPINAMRAGNRMIEALDSELRLVPHTELGGVTMNLAGGNAGTLTPDGVIVKPNTVPDQFELLVEVRTNSGEIDGKPVGSAVVTEILQRMAEVEQVVIENTATPLEVAAWLSSRDNIGWFEQIVGNVTNVAQVPQRDMGNRGLDEMAILMEALNKGRAQQVDGAIWGRAEAATFHKPDEHVTTAGIADQHEVTKQVITSPQFKRATYSTS